MIVNKNGVFIDTHVRYRTISDNLSKQEYKFLLTTTLTISEFENRMIDIMKKYPYLVIERDGRIEGYAYAHAFVGRAAYDWASELTIYLDHNAKKCGLGRKLYEALADRLKDMGVLNLYACIGYPEG